MGEVVVLAPRQNVLKKDCLAVPASLVAFPVAQRLMNLLDKQAQPWRPSKLAPL